MPVCVAGAPDPRDQPGLVPALGNILSQLSRGGGARGVNIDEVGGCVLLDVVCHGADFLALKRHHELDM